MTIRVLLADDQALLRSAFRVLVDSEPDMEVVGEASDGAEAVRLAREECPDVVLMDIRMPGTDGLAATRLISADPALAQVRVVILTTVEVARTDQGTTLPAAVDLAAYRVIQEALTNVQKHAGTAAKAEVSVVRVGPNVEITVLDDGAGDDDTVEGGGHGLLGMRERVTALRGTLTTGPRYGGGFRVHAILPLKSRTRAAEDAV